MKSLDIRGVTHQYDQLIALNDLSFSIEQGELFCVLGPNGSGKSTLFRCLSTLMRPTSGTIILDEHIDLMSDPGIAREVIGTVFQHHSLDRLMSVEENLYLSAALFGISRAEAKSRITELADVFDLTDRLTTRVDRLSGGLIRRVDLLRGLLHAPDVLLLDEPTTGLDPAARALFWQTLERVRATRLTTVVFTTHLMEEAEVSDRLVIIDRGSVVVSGTPHDIKKESSLEKVIIRSAGSVEIGDWLNSRDDVEWKTSSRGIYASTPDPVSLVRDIRNKWRDQLDEITIRRPSLEDIFFENTGRRFDDREQSTEENL
jgi:ABC-2 type transport system ATP-binding protein